jgi:hypothetical protein
MPDSLEGVLLLALLVLPGFILVGVSQLDRPPGREEKDLVITLRSFAIALAIQVPVFPLWTRCLLHDMDGDFDGLLDHSLEAAAYAGTILLLLPVVLGLMLRAVLANAERKSSLSLLDRLLGARLPDNAWDTLLRQLHPKDVLVVGLTGGRTIAGAWSSDSFASRAGSSSPSLYLSELWALDQNGTPAAPLPKRWKGVWIPRSQIESIIRYEP